MSAVRGTGKFHIKAGTKEAGAAYLMMAPAVLVLFIFLYFPIFYALFVSFTDWNIIGKMKFSGVSNYIKMFADRFFLRALGKTILYALIYSPLLFATSLGLSLFVKHLRRASGTFRTFFFAPIVISSIAGGMVWKLIFDEKRGVFTTIVQMFGGRGQAWLGRESTAYAAAIGVHIWLQMGYYMIIFLAALQEVPRDHYEAGRLDGASPPQLFWHITLPGIAPTNVFVLVMSFIISFQAYDQIVLLSAGGPNGATRLVVQEIYETAFKMNQMGYSASKAFMLFAIILVVTVVQLSLRRSDRGIGG